MSKQTVELGAADLNQHGGVYCPNPAAHMDVWNTHPKVYLDVAKTGSAKCPYCGTEYALRAGEQLAHGH
ncbi:zinc-finger domain-containing protein [Comamonadaceae bacterium M7527]|nr:zinc-finger domain-containing protein [Comamonadaceae bacterium M7527]